MYVEEENNSIQKMKENLFTIANWKNVNYALVTTHEKRNDNSKRYQSLKKMQTFEWS